jgi:hypothetical protein
MDRAMLKQHSAQAERHVLLGERHITEQQARIGELERGGHDTGQAIQLLYQFEEMQELHIAHRDRLRKELRQ